MEGGASTAATVSTTDESSSSRADDRDEKEGSKKPPVQDFRNAVRCPSSYYERLEEPVEESADFVEQKIGELEFETKELEATLKFGYLKAMQRSPHLVDTREHKLMFLRSESFDAELAAIRLVRYWNKRLDLFGEDRAFREIGTLRDRSSLKEDSAALELGMFQLTYKVDVFGRVIIFEDPTLMHTGAVSNTALTRALWYVLHAALLDEDFPGMAVQLQRFGMILVLRRDHHSQFFNRPFSSIARSFDHRSFVMLTESLFGVLPINIGAVHFVRPPRVIAMVVAPVLRRMVGPLLKGCVVIHQTGQGRDSGTNQSKEDGKKKKELDKALIREMEDYGIAWDSLPPELGGGLQIDSKSWLEDRRKRTEEILNNEAGKTSAEDEEKEKEKLKSLVKDHFEYSKAQ